MGKANQNPNVVLFKFGSLSAYKALGTYEDNALYFIHDDVTGENRLYKGEQMMAYQQVILSKSVPLVDDAEEGIAYVVVADGKASLYVKNENEIIEVSSSKLEDGAIDSIEMFGENILLKGAENNDKIPTEGAVRDIIKEEVKNIPQWEEI